MKPLLSRRRNNLSLLLQQWFSNKNGRPLFLSTNECMRVRERERREYRGRRKHLALIEAGASAKRTKHITPILVPKGPNPHNILSVIQQTAAAGAAPITDSFFSAGCLLMYINFQAA
jgi:hypothetical protein